MSLQVRLRHTLGERLLELPDRPVDEPVAVGRSSTADVQVPSVTVASRHCVLFVHDGRWAIQDIAGNAGTFVNGSKIAGPTLLRVGDVITLGADANAPTLEVDPAGAARGRAGQPAGAVGAAPAEAAVPAGPGATSVPQPGVASGAYAAPQPYGYPAPPQPGMQGGAPTYGGSTAWAPAAPTADEPAAAGGGDTIGWPTDAGSTPLYYSRRARRRSNSGFPLGVLLTLLLAGGVGYFFYQRQQQTAQVAAPALPGTTQKVQMPSTRRTGADEDTSQMPNSIFDKSDPRRGKAETRPAPRRRPPGTTASAGGAQGEDPGPTGEGDGSTEPMTGDAPDAVQDAVSPPLAPAQAGPSADDPEWKQVQAARFSRDEAKAILKFDDYARSHPEQFSSQLTEFTDKALDRIWLERLEQLCKQREELARKIQDADKEAGEETNEAYKKRVLVPLKEKYAAALQTVGEELKDGMKYGASTVPNLLDESQVESLRRQRDPASYAGWKSRVLTHIRRTHGELPWANDKNG